ncbi:MAG: polysaccharide biosynthesis C-terminal domain-containing protein [Bacteroidota bacterium]
MGVFGKNYLHTVVTNVVLKLVVGLVISVVTARALGPEGRGEYNLLILIITTLTTLFNFGIPGSNTYFVAKKTIDKGKLMRASFFISAWLSLFSFLLLFTLYRVDYLRYLFPVERLTTTMIVSFAIIPIVFFNVFAQGIVVGENKIYLNNYIYLGSQTTQAATLAGAYLLGILSVQLAIALFAVSNLVSFAIIGASYRSTIFAFASHKMEWREYKQLLVFSTPLQLGNIIQFLNYRLGTFIVNYFLGTTSVGLFFMAVNLVEILWLLSTSMAAVLLPTVAAQHEQSKKISLKAAVASFALTLAAAALAIPIAPFAIVHLFGKDFAGSITPFFILLPGITIFSLTNVLAAYMTGIGKPGLNTAISFVALIFTVVLNVELVPRYGISGAAIASSVSYIILSLLTLVIFVKLSGLTWRENIEFISSLKNDLQSITMRTRLKIQSIVP